MDPEHVNYVMADIAANNMSASGSQYPTQTDDEPVNLETKVPTSDAAGDSTSGEPQIDEIKEGSDDGYEADVDQTFPDGFEEPGADNDDECSSISAGEEKSSIHDNMVDKFQNLNCDKKPDSAFDVQSDSGRRGNPVLKRSHSEESLTDTEEDAMPDKASASPEYRRIRRRMTHPSRASHISRGRSAADPSEPMEVDQQGDPDEVLT